MWELWPEHIAAMIWVEGPCFGGTQSVSKVNVAHVGHAQPSASGGGQDTRCCRKKSSIRDSAAGQAAFYVELSLYCTWAFFGRWSWGKHSAAEMEGWLLF